MAKTDRIKFASGEDAALPALRPYTVQRWNHQLEEMEELTILAHGVHTSDDVLRFVRIVNDPELGPREMVVRALNGWVEFREEWVETTNMTLN